MVSENVKGPFVFQNGIYLVELTGKKARNLKEFLEEIKNIDEHTFFYHMYHSMLKFHHIISEYHNDFAYWLDKTLHEDVLAEKIASIHVDEYRDVEDFRNDLVTMIEEHIEKHGMKVQSLGEYEESDFHFKKAITVVQPTKYSASNLEEFLECLKNVRAEVIFYHFIESRLRLAHEKGVFKDDFTRWISETLEVNELADEISNLNPFGYTIEGLRKKLIQLVEKYLEKKE